MTPPRIQADERGITITKSLGWAMAVGLVSLGLFFGTELTGTKSAVVSLGEQQAERHQETLSYRRGVDDRIRQLETRQATTTADADAVRREIGLLRSDIRELSQLLRGITP